MAYNEEHGITPRTIEKSKSPRSILDIRAQTKAYVESEEPNIAADPVVQYMSRDQLENTIAETERKMKAAAKDLDFITAAQLRDELFALRKRVKSL